MSTGTTAVLSGFLERIKKYTKKWGRRFCTFDPTTRRLTYSDEDKENGAVKAAMTVTKVSRCAESRDTLVGPDLFTMNIDGTVEGTGADANKNDSWSFRFPSEEVFDTWYEHMRRALATAGLTEPFNYGLPAVDPRQGLTFAKVPLTHLQKFGLLEKTIMYSFTVVRYFDAATNTCPEAILVIGDKLIYMFRPNADVLRCTQIVNVKQVSYTKGTDLIGITIAPPEPDLILQSNDTLEHVKHVLAVQYRAMTQGKHVPLVPMTETKLETLGGKMRAKGEEGWKLEIASPTAKSRLKHALDQYEKQEGVRFDPSTHRQRKGQQQQQQPQEGGARQNSVGLPSGGSSPAGAAGSADMTIPLVRLLHRLQLTQYAAQLLKQHVDLDVLQCMDLADLETFGVKTKEHGQRILDAANNAELVKQVMAETTTSSKMLSGDSFASSTGSTSAAASTTPNIRSQPPPSGGATTASPPPAATPAKPTITLSDDEDDLDVMMASSPSAKKPIIVLDDSDDDDLDLLPPVAASPQAANKAPILLPDDDDI